jgi:hypothetical protein
MPYISGSFSVARHGTFTLALPPATSLPGGYVQTVTIGTMPVPTEPPQEEKGFYGTGCGEPSPGRSFGFTCTDHGNPGFHAAPHSLGWHAPPF